MSWWRKKEDLMGGQKVVRSFIFSWQSRFQTSHIPHPHTPPPWRVPEVGGARMWRAWPGDGEAVNYLTHRWRGYNGLAALTPLLMLGLQALGVSLFTLFLPSSCGRCSFFLSSFPLPLSSFCLLPLLPPRTAGDDRFLCQQTSPELILTGLLASTLLASCRNAVAFFLI